MNLPSLLKIALGFSVVLNCILFVQRSDERDKSETAISGFTLAQIEYALNSRSEKQINQHARLTKIMPGERMEAFLRDLGALDSVYTYYSTHMTELGLMNSSEKLTASKRNMILQMREPIVVSEELADSLLYTYPNSNPPINKTEASLQLLLTKTEIIEYARRCWNICEVPIDHGTVVIDSSIFITQSILDNFIYRETDSISIRSVIIENDGLPLSRCHLYRSGKMLIIKLDVPKKLLVKDALIYIKMDYHMQDAGTFSKHYSYVLWDTDNSKL